MEISYIGVVLGLVAITLGIISAQNIKNELKDTRILMISELKDTRILLVTVTQRSDLLTKLLRIELYLDNLINLASRLKLIVKTNPYKITESGNSTLSDLRVFDYLETIYRDQPDITKENLIIHILSESHLVKRVWYFNEKRENRKQLTLPFEAILATVIVHHELRHEKSQ